MYIGNHFYILTGIMDFDNRLLSFVGQLADTADDIARKYWRTSFETEQKSDKSPVTIADKEIETAMRAMIEAEFPTHGIIGEEHGNIRPESDYQWVLDPIDGTRAFIAGIPTFTTLIALCENNVPKLGVISQAISKERWISSKINEKPSAVKNLSQAKISTTSANYFKENEAAAFEKLAKKCAGITHGGDAYSYAMLAIGKMDIVVDASMKPYDFCALVPVIESTGGIITDWDGGKVTINSDGKILAAANAELHNQALSTLQA